MTSRIFNPTALFALIAISLAAIPAQAASVPKIIDDFGTTGTRVSIVTQNRATVTWSPKLDFYILFDRHTKANAVRVALLKDGKPQGESWACGFSSSIEAYQSNQTTGRYPYPLSSFTCSAPKSVARTDSGTFQLALTYKETLAGKDHDLGTLAFDVMEVLHGSPVNTKKTYALNWDHMLGTATVFEGATSEDLKSLARVATRASFHDTGASSPVMMSFWTKYERESDPGSSTLTCLKGDEIVRESRPGAGESHSYWTFNDDQSKSVVAWKRQTFTFKQLYMRRKTPDDAEAKRAAQRLASRHPSIVIPYYLSENPGDYRCVATAEGAVTAEIRFTIAEDGNLVGRDCGDAINRPDTVREVLFDEKGTTSMAFDKEARNAPYFGRAKKSAACRI